MSPIFKSVFKLKRSIECTNFKQCLKYFFFLIFTWFDRLQFNQLFQKKTKKKNKEGQKQSVLVV